MVMVLPASAAAQSPGDTIELVVPEDVDCSDFEAVLGAQPYYEAGRILGLSDVFGLDGDGNAVACEGLDFIRHRAVTTNDSLKYESWSTEQPAEAKCPWTERFDIDEHVDALRRAPIDTVENERRHKDRSECLYSLGRLNQLSN